MLAAQQLSAQRQRLAVPCLGFGQFALPVEHVGQVVEGLSHLPAFRVGFLSEGQRRAVHRFRLAIFCQRQVNASQCAAQFRLDLRLLLEVFANAGGSLVQNLPQHFGVTPFGGRGADAFEHALKEFCHLPALGGLGLRALLGRYGYCAQPDLLAFRPRGAHRLPGARH